MVKEKMLLLEARQTRSSSLEQWRYPAVDWPSQRQTSLQLRQAFQAFLELAVYFLAISEDVGPLRLFQNFVVRSRSESVAQQPGLSAFLWAELLD